MMVEIMNACFLPYFTASLVIMGITRNAVMMEFTQEKSAGQLPAAA